MIGTERKLGFVVAATILGLLLMMGFAVSGQAMSVMSDWGSDLRLVKFEQAGCHYCELWEEEVGISYDKTSEGRFAPLTRMHINDGRANGITAVNYTPTFVLIRDGHEVGRLTGYVSADFFWGLLEPMLEEQGYTAVENSSNRAHPE